MKYKKRVEKKPEIEKEFKKTQINKTRNSKKY